MNNINLKEAQADFEETIPELENSKKQVLKYRSEFVKYFNTKKISLMKTTEYALGYSKSEDKFNFCYGLETKLKDLGWMIGGTSRKFGFWYGVENNDKTQKLRIIKRLNAKSEKEALMKTRNAILELLLAGKTKNINKIINNIISPMFKGKILSTYYPDKYLNIFSRAHLEHFINHLNIGNDELYKKDEVILREILLDYKNIDEVYSNWKIETYVDFLYYYYYGHPKKLHNPEKTEKGKSIKQLEKYKRLTFPLNQKAELIEQSIEKKFSNNTKSKINPKKKNSNSKNYQEAAIRNNQIGERGEKIVLDFEKNRLVKFPILQNKIKQVSIDSNSYGYDIKSYNVDGTERNIEVKTTVAKVGDANFFLTINELNVAEKNNNYFIYIVFEILSIAPKIWIINNPFNPKNNSITLTPVTFKVEIKTKSLK